VAVRWWPTSPRRRRRLVWYAAGAVVVLLAALLVLILPGSPKRVPEHLRPDRPAKSPREVRLTPAMRRGIDATMARFVPAAVTRNDPALAWELAGPGLRAGSTRRGWLRGQMPVYRFPWNGERGELLGWTPVFTYRNHVGFDIALSARKGTRASVMEVSVDVVRRGSTWLVNYWNVTRVS
jgi:hypothetical protein